MYIIPAEDYKSWPLRSRLSEKREREREREQSGETIADISAKRSPRLTSGYRNSPPLSRHENKKEKEKKKREKIGKTAKSAI